jgi:hypothetical protein
MRLPPGNFHNRLQRGPAGLLHQGQDRFRFAASAGCLGTGFLRYGRFLYAAGLLLRGRFLRRSVGRLLRIRGYSGGLFRRRLGFRCNWSLRDRNFIAGFRGGVATFNLPAKLAQREWLAGSQAGSSNTLLMN